ncbi:maspardin-like isoform X2 [Dendronephthya gigantea]|uniref:maspardin-like isoform X2 n=1 Tax=Dendronephthya gigantea TaxID=151771 RepID=UPI001069F785|nr:maspardin-like isoform X2 [Dendronephthya gigantea]
MSQESDIRRSQEYQSFRSTVPKRKVIVDPSSEKSWTIYDAGPRNVRCPLICLPPVSGTADVFFKQILSLTSLGYRVIAVEYPVYWTYAEWVEGMKKLLDFLKLDKVHFFGASLGGFLAQKFAEVTSKSPRTCSIVLCNSFGDTTVFENTSVAYMYWAMPGFYLKKMVMENFTTKEVDPDIADSIDFMVENLDGLERSSLASRLTLNCLSSYVEPQKIANIPMTIIDVFDECALSDQVKESLYKLYPHAKRAHLKSGGNFPYLCRSSEVNLYLQIHLRQFARTRYSAVDPEGAADEELMFVMNEKPTSETDSLDEDN